MPSATERCLYNGPFWGYSDADGRALAPVTETVAMTPPVRIVPPWSADQVAALNRWQHTDRVHPFTCPEHAAPDHAGHPVLRATTAGWVCDACDYRQDWAWQAMTEPVPELAAVVIPAPP